MSIRSISCALAAVAIAGAVLAVIAQAQSQEVVEVTVEKRQAVSWQPVSSQTVFHTKDDIRFRVRSRISGYLYVLNHESGGDETWLYPRPEQQSDNHIAASTSYLVPDSPASFTVGGEPGFDITYWMITPQPMSLPARASGKRSKPNTLLPRCGSELLRARGVCEDKQAGPHAISDSDHIPSAFSGAGGLVARDLSFQSNQSAVQVLAPEPPSGSIVYALWIAHK